MAENTIVNVGDYDESWLLTWDDLPGDTGPVPQDLSEDELPEIDIDQLLNAGNAEAVNPEDLGQDQTNEQNGDQEANLADAPSEQQAEGEADHDTIVIPHDDDTIVIPMQEAGHDETL